jgi:hypothetical protein
MGEGELELCLPSPMFGRGAGGEGKDLSLHWDAPFFADLLFLWGRHFVRPSSRVVQRVGVEKS